MIDLNKLSLDVQNKKMHLWSEYQSSTRLNAVVNPEVRLAENKNKQYHNGDI